MDSINDTLRSLPSSQQLAFYMGLAHTALRAYDLGDLTPRFLQHNSGISYCVESSHGAPRYLLKIHEPAGDGRKATADEIHARMAWLAALSSTLGLAVQTPLLNRYHSTVTICIPAPQHAPVHCTLQQWIAGEHVRGDFTVPQIAEVGHMIAKLHIHSAGWQAQELEQLPRAEATVLKAQIGLLQQAVPLGLLSADQYTMIDRAGTYIQSLVTQIGQTYATWGAVHGDLHHENILFSAGQARPIDFDALHTSYYLRDLGVMLYHILHQEQGIRQALLAGYCATRALPAGHLGYLEAFVTWAAIDNLAFQITLPQQRTTSLFARNVRQLADYFCRQLLAGRAFALVDS